MKDSQAVENQNRKIVEACQKLHARGLVANHDGNISCRLESGHLLATPTSFSKGDVTAADILTLDPSGKVIEGPHKVFSEIAWHLAVYRVRPDVNCVVHAHPPAASGFGLANREIGTPALPEAIVSLGRHILTAKFFSPLDPELNKTDGEFDREIHRVLNESDAFVARGNGAWAVGIDIMQTYYRLELVEQVALQHLHAENLGGVLGLPSALVEDLLKKRPRSQAQSPIAARPAQPLPAPIPAAPKISADMIRDVVRSELESLKVFT